MIPKKLPEGLKQYICEGFKFIQQSDELEYKQKKIMLENLLSLGAGSGWRPEAITLNALKLFIENDFKKPLGLARAHKFHRRDTYKILIETEWKDYEWWDWYLERDYTTLSTREENRNEANFKNLTTFKIPLELNLFWGARVGFEYKEAEKDFLKDLAKKL